MTTTNQKCHRCEGQLEVRCIDHDVGPLLGMRSVILQNFPAPVCNACGAVVVDGAIFDALSMVMTAHLIQQTSLDGTEVRFLRKQLSYTQEALAGHLGVTRVSVARWESGETLDGISSYAVRSHVFFRLRDVPLIASLVSNFAEYPDLSAREELAFDYSRILQSFTNSPTAIHA